MGSVGDWYQNRAHRDDLNPVFDRATDDGRDPFSFGEDPGGRWSTADRSGSSTPWAWAETTRSAKKTRTKPVDDRRAAPRRRKQSAPERWKAELKRWLGSHPTATSTAARAHLREVGFFACSQQQVHHEMVRLFDASRREHRQPRGQLAPDARARKPFVRSQPPPGPPRETCNACGLVVTATGSCRC